MNTIFDGAISCYTALSIFIRLGAEADKEAECLVSGEVKELAETVDVDAYKLLDGRHLETPVECRFHGIFEVQVNENWALPVTTSLLDEIHGAVLLLEEEAVEKLQELGVLGI
jgi:hypothetical protein